MFKGKPVRVMLGEKASEDFDYLNKLVSTEITKGIVNSENQTLLKAIKQKIELLKQNPQYGVHIPKNKIPAEYIRYYEANNLWKVNLPGAWMIIYTIYGDELEIVSFILDIISHKDYEKKFKYRKR